MGNPALQLKSATNAAWSRVLESASRTEVKQLLNEPLAELDSVWKEGKPFVRTVRRRVWLELLHRSDVVRQTVLHCHFTVCAQCRLHTRCRSPCIARRNRSWTCLVLSSTRTRTTEFLYSEEREDEAKTIRCSIASRIRVDKSKLEDLFLATFFLFTTFTKLAATRTPRLSMA